MANLNSNLHSNALFEEQPLLPSQRWFLNESHELIEMERYNVDILCRIITDVDFYILNEAICKVIQSHDILRAHFVLSKEMKWHQFIDIKSPLNQLKIIDLSSYNSFEFLNEIEKNCKQIQDTEPFNLQKSELIRFYLFYGPQKCDPFFWIYAHHLILDGLSMHILLEDIFSRYSQIKSDSKAPFPKLKSNQYWFADFIEHYNKYIYPIEMQYWLQHPLADMAALPKDYNRPINDNTISSFTTIKQCFNIEDSHKLINCNKFLPDNNISLPNLLLCALGHALLIWTNGNMIDVEVINNGRKYFQDLIGIDFSESLGWFAISRLIFFKRLSLLNNENLVRAYFEQVKSIPNKGFGFEFFNAFKTETEFFKIFSSGPKKSGVLFNFLGQLHSFKSDYAVQVCDIDTGLFQNPNNIHSHLLECNVLIVDNIVEIHWQFGRNLFNEKSIIYLSDIFTEFLKGNLNG